MKAHSTLSRCPLTRCHLPSRVRWSFHPTPTQRWPLSRHGCSLFSHQEEGGRERGQPERLARLFSETAGRWKTTRRITEQNVAFYPFTQTDARSDTSRAEKRWLMATNEISDEVVWRSSISHTHTTSPRTYLYIYLRNKKYFKCVCFFIAICTLAAYQQKRIRSKSNLAYAPPSEQCSTF